jgi:hypothetical protein
MSPSSIDNKLWVTVWGFGGKLPGSPWKFIDILLGSTWPYNCLIASDSLCFQMKWTIRIFNPQSLRLKHITRISLSNVLGFITAPRSVIFKFSTWQVKFFMNNFELSFSSDYDSDVDETGTSPLEMDSKWWPSTCRYVLSLQQSFSHSVPCSDSRLSCCREALTEIGPIKANDASSQIWRMQEISLTNEMMRALMDWQRNF